MNACDHSDLREPASVPNSRHQHMPQRQTMLVQRAFCLAVARLALRSLYRELQLYPKPGLVSPIDSGSHTDMNAVTFMRSLFALRHYFIRITEAGVNGARFATLRQLGIDAEQAMLRATAGINTHRGAIFSLGLLCAATGYCRGQGTPLSATAIRAALRWQWGDALNCHMHVTTNTSHGKKVAEHYAVSGAAEEAALGFPSLFELALPRFLKTLNAGRDDQSAAIDTLFTLMAHINDTNTYHRGGLNGAEKVKERARQFLEAGGTAANNWREHAISCHLEFIQDKLSPGGAADLLAATFLLHELSYLR